MSPRKTRDLGNSFTPHDNSEETLTVIHEGLIRRLGPQDVVAYRDALVGLSIPAAIADEMVDRFERLCKALVEEGDREQAFWDWLQYVRRVASDLTRSGTLSELRGKLAVQASWQPVCDGICNPCVSQGPGLPDLLFLACFPWFGGWKCVYLKVPRGTC
jgi:hypothetical protein